MKFVARLAAVITALMILNGPAQADRIKIAASSWPPYTDEKLPNKGLAVDLVTTAFKRAGYQTRVNLESWPRTLEGVQIGVYDVIAAAWYSKEREQKFVFSEPYLTNRVRLVKRKGQMVQVNSLADLRGLRVGIVTAYAYGDKFDKATHFKKVPQNHVIQNLLMLVNAKIDLTLGDEFVIRHQIQEFMPHQMQKLEFIPKAIVVKKLYIAVSKNNPKHTKIVADFNKAMKAMKADGSYQKIVDKHLKSLAPKS